jgi:uncharacterized Fe-S cluster-containing radical SAM superfamily protein
MAKPRYAKLYESQAAKANEHNQQLLAKMLDNHEERPKRAAIEPTSAPITPSFPFDPIERARQVESLVMRGSERKYYRFRFQEKWWAPVVADSVGCLISCAYCWNSAKNRELPGKYMSAPEVANRLNSLGAKHNAWYFRTGGCEPILGEASLNHYVELLEKCEASRFLLESNGLMLGYHPEYIKKLEPFKNMLRFRISAKADNPERFEMLSGAKREFFEYPFIAIREAARLGFDCDLAYMPEFTNETRLRRAAKWSGKCDGENLTLYKGVKDNLMKRKCWDLQYSSIAPAVPCWITSEKDEWGKL